MMKTNFLAAMLFITTLTAGVTSCKKDSAVPSNDIAAQQPEVPALKSWYVEAATKAKSEAKSASVLKGGTLIWQKAAYSGTENAYLVPIKLEGKSSVFSFLKLSKGKTGKIESGKYLIFIPKVNSTTEQNLAAVPENFSGAVLEYDLKNNLLAGNYLENGMKTQSAKIFLREKGNSTAKETCTEWYLDTYENGVLIHSQYLFTECTGSDGTPHTTLDGDGVIVGGGQPGMSEADFDNYTHFNLPNNDIEVTGTEGPDPNTGVFTWTVAEGAIASWKIIANTQYGYYKSSWYNVNHFEYNYDLFDYHTISTAYVGSNTFITSTWTQSNVIDHVFNNNTASTYGTSQVIGTIKHTANFSITLPIGSAPTLLSQIDPINNSVILKPR
jgi:hypothetical protein